ncbi:hypothetical protein PRIPAC_97849 [Pristionchus pacificus]|uniref:Uncharacterized protein n=1 Tax=Pristionchus pacificus TaxID=54126 RepID=A0A2A6B2C9_PRIPA|nr:hypothetical protein PRIPAC_97849 [Pristionchus pacificus]|eukprot:PDM60038.1 hypothetical protein PRIPAC_49324 [Pristionchus pacificus]
MPPRGLDVGRKMLTRCAWFSSHDESRFCAGIFFLQKNTSEQCLLLSMCSIKSQERFVFHVPEDKLDVAVRRAAAQNPTDEASEREYQSTRRKRKKKRMTSSRIRTCEDTDQSLLKLASVHRNDLGPQSEVPVTGFTLSTHVVLDPDTVPVPELPPAKWERRKLSESGQDNKSVKALNVKRTHSWPHIGRPVAALVVVVARVPQQPSVSGVSTPPVHLPVVVAGAQSASSKQPEFLHLVPVFYIGLNIKYREYTPNGNQDSRCIVKIWFTESWTA